MLATGSFFLALSIIAADSPEGTKDTEGITAALGAGAQLMLTYEPSGPNEGALAVNVFPLVVEWESHFGVGLRLAPIVNYQFDGDGSGIAHVGAGVSAPVYFGLESPSPGDRYYVGPYVGVVQNRLTDGRETSLALEGGIRWMLTESLAFALALQLGTTRFSGTTSDATWTGHAGVYPALMLFGG